MKFKNVYAQILSLILLAFTFSGLSVNPDEVSTRIIDYLSNGQFVALLSYLVINLGNIFIHWYQQWKSDPKKLLAFVDSVNFWIGVGNIILSIVLLTTGININPESLQEVITLVFSKDWWGAATVFVANILIPLLKTFIKKEDRKIIPLGSPQPLKNVG